MTTTLERVNIKEFLEEYNKTRLLKDIPEWERQQFIELNAEVVEEKEEHCSKCNIPLGMSNPPSYTCWNVCPCHGKREEDMPFGKDHVQRVGEFFASKDGEKPAGDCTYHCIGNVHACGRYEVAPKKKIEKIPFTFNPTDLAVSMRNKINELCDFLNQDE